MSVTTLTTTYTRTTSTVAERNTHEPQTLGLIDAVLANRYCLEKAVATE